MKIKADLHIHSENSYDSKMSLKKIVSIAKKKGIGLIAITDHEKMNIEYMNKIFDKDILIIKGQEIDTEFGDIIGLFLEKEIKSKNFSEVVKNIRLQKGIIMLPHPARNHILTEEVLKKIDIIEGYNAKTGKRTNEMAKELAKKMNKNYIASSDAHNYYEIGMGIIELDIKRKNIEDFKNALLDGNYKVIKEDRPSRLLRGLSLLKRVL